MIVFFCTFPQPSSSLGGLSFGYDTETEKYGYWKKEADSEEFVPFKSGGKLVTTTINGIANPQTGTGNPTFTLTKTLPMGIDENNISVSFKETKYRWVNPNQNYSAMAYWSITSYNYDSSTGELTVIVYLNNSGFGLNYTTISLEATILVSYVV